MLPPIEYPGILAPAAREININSQIMDTYINSILPGEGSRAASRLQGGPSDQLQLLHLAFFQYNSLPSTTVLLHIWVDIFVRCSEMQLASLATHYWNEGAT